MQIRFSPDGILHALHTIDHLLHQQYKSEDSPQHCSVQFNPLITDWSSASFSRFTDFLWTTRFIYSNYTSFDWFDSPPIQQNPTQAALLKQFTFTSSRFILFVTAAFIADYAALATKTFYSQAI